MTVVINRFIRLIKLRELLNDHLLADQLKVHCSQSVSQSAMVCLGVCLGEVLCFGEVDLEGGLKGGAGIIWVGYVQNHAYSC